jgi:hypothetical protein
MADACSIETRIVFKISGRTFGRKIADSRHQIAACTIHIMQKTRAKYNEN